LAKNVRRHSFIGRKSGMLTLEGCFFTNEPMVTAAEPGVREGAMLGRDSAELH
jgi:hypothetical protein